MATSSQTPVKSQNDIIKAHLLSGRPITSWQAITDYRITCLAQRIHNLKNAGVAINSELVKENGKQFSRYSIAPHINNIDTDGTL